VAQKVAETLTDEEVLRELLKREAEGKVKDVLLGDSFPQQTAFINDTSRLKAACTTRRSGKTMAAVLDLLITGYEHPGSTMLFIGLTLPSVKKTAWKDCLLVLNARYGLSLSINKTEMSATLPNGSIIYFVGGDSNSTIRDRFLGTKIRKAVIDEAGSHRQDLRALVYEVLRPATIDLRGTIVLIGTPQPIKGLFWAICQGKEKGWTRHQWTAADNPYVAKEWEEELAEIQATRPEFMLTPQFQMHYLGLWVQDDEKTVYKFHWDRNVAQELPAIDRAWNHVLGIDLGYNDATAFSLCAYQEEVSNRLYVRKFEKETKLIVSDVARRIQGYILNYHPEVLVIDGANKQAVEELRRRFQLPLVAADKRGKTDYIEIMNSEFIQGHIKVIIPEDQLEAVVTTNEAGGKRQQGAAALVEEYEGLVWDDRPGLLQRREHPGCENHGTDATLYAFRHTYSYVWAPPAERAKRGSPEWFQEQEQATVERMVRDAKFQKNPQEEWLDDEEDPWG